MDPQAFHLPLIHRSSQVKTESLWSVWTFYYCIVELWWTSRVFKSSCNWMFRQSSAFRSYVRAEVEARPANGSRDPHSGLKGEAQQLPVFTLHTQRR